MKVYFTRQNHFLLIVSCFISPITQSEVTLDGSMGASGALPGPNYQITEDLGQRTGNNLFHSFGQFNINSSESATFSGSASIQNVVGRVTGGQVSTIDGAFRSTIPGANIYFINPSGVIFGENASLDVQGSFHASTANYLKFKDGVKFETGIATANPILTTAAPEAFGFLDNTPASISVSGGLNKVLEVPEGETLSLVGGDISIDNRSLYAPGGQVILASAGSAGELVFNESGIDTSSFTQGGKIQLSRAASNPVVKLDNGTNVADIDVSADSAGKVVIRGGQMVMDNTYIWVKTTNGNADSLTINTQSLKLSKGARIENTSYGIGASGNLEVNAGDSLEISKGALIDTSSYSSGDGGEVSIKANSILLTGENTEDTTGIINTVFSAGDTGGLTITTNNFELLNGAVILANNASSGNGGDIIIDAHKGSVLLSGAGTPRPTYLTASSLPETTGTTGNIIINSNSLQIKEGAAITAFTTNSDNNDQMVQINAHSVLLSGFGSSIRTGTVASSATETNTNVINSTANSAKIDLNVTGGLELSDFTFISSITSTNGRAGDISINANTINLSEGQITSDASSYNGKELPEDTSRTGDAGDITIQAENLRLSNGAFISTDTETKGHGGNITVDAKTVLLSGSKTRTTSSGEKGVLSSSILAQTHSNDDNAGDAGTITLNNVDLLDIRNGAKISTNTYGAGMGGDIMVDANSVFISTDNNANTISSVTTLTTSHKDNAGAAGKMTVKSEHINIQGGKISVSTSGAGNGGELTIDAGTINLFGENTDFLTGVFASTHSTGNSRETTINVGHLDIRDTARISASTFGNGNAGDLKINAGSIFIKGDQSTFFTGIANQANGDIDNLVIYKGNAGNLTINAKDTIELHENATISSSTFDEGTAGNVTVHATDILLNNSAIKSSSNLDNFDLSTDPDKAKSGTIFITAKNTLRLENESGISVETEKAHAGEINIVTGNSLNLVDSGIATSVANGEGNGGNINVISPIVSLDSSQIVAKAKKGTGGKISVSGLLFKSPLSVIDASSELSTDGELNLKPVTNISGAIAVLPESLLNASEYLSDRCGNRSEENKNSFMIKSRGGVPLSPGKLAPSTLIDITTPTDHHFGSTKSPNKQVSSLTATKHDKFLAFNQQVGCRL